MSELHDHEKKSRREKKSWVEFDDNSQPVDSSEVGSVSVDKIIHEGDMEMLIGQILTSLEATMEPDSKLFALKKVVKNFCWGMWEVLDENATFTIKDSQYLTSVSGHCTDTKNRKGQIFTN